LALELSPAKYGKLLAKALPKRIETDEEFDRMVEAMEELSRAISEHKAGPEETALHDLLSMLVKEYDDRVYPLPPVAPHKIIQHMMEQRELRQADLLPVFGSRSIASDVINGKREPSKAHIRKLAEFFHVSPALFLEA
jgi:HTH-type transcriptional regulator/antitoxin HigA